MTGPGENEARTYPAGVTCWIDTAQGDVEAATAFYGGLLGWTFTDAMPPEAPGRYVIADLGGQDVAAIGSAGASPDQPPRWATYVAVDDADDTAARAEELGATVLAPPADAGPGGRSAVLRDPEGCEIRLWQARRRLGAQLTNAPGTWNFSNLRTNDPGAAQRFYGELLGWRFEDQGWATSIQVPGYGDHLEATVDPGIRTRQAQAPDGFEDVIGAMVPADEQPAGWYVVLTVADRDATAAEAERLGGTVLSRFETGWTAEAVVQDPQGAVFHASQFTPPSDWG